MAALTIAWIAKRPGTDAIFKAFSWSIAIFAPVVTLIFSGPHILFGVVNDVFSAPYAAAFVGFGVISGGVAQVLPARAPIKARLGALALAGSLLLVAIVVAMPGVLAGPYAVIDPVSRSLWLEHVDQEHTVLLLLRAGIGSATFNLALQGAIILWAGMLAAKRLGQGEAAPAVVLFMGIAAFAANLDAFRFIRFPPRSCRSSSRSFWHIWARSRWRSRNGLLQALWASHSASAGFFKRLPLSCPCARS